MKKEKRKAEKELRRLNKKHKAEEEKAVKKEVEEDEDEKRARFAICYIEQTNNQDFFMESIWGTKNKT